MSLRRMMIFTLGAKIKSLIQAFKERVLSSQGEFEAETCLDTQLTDLDNKGLLDSASFVLTPNAYEENILFAVEPDKVGTNLLRWSEDFTQTIWLKNGSATVTGNTVTAPDGTNTADTLQRTTTNGTVFQSSVSLTAGQTYTASIYLRADTNGTINIGMASGAVFLLRNITTSWQRYTFTFTQATTTNDGLAIFLQASNTLSSVYAWGAQLELGSTATDYISTTDRAIINGTIGDMSVTRSTTGTRVNADGFIEQVPYNLLSRSEEFDNASWFRQNILSISTNVVNSPVGTLTADKIIPDTTSNQHRIFQQFNFTGAGVLSVYAKADGYNFLSLAIGGGVAGGAIIFDLSNGTISGTAGGFVPSIENVGNGWYRCSIYRDDLGGGVNLSYWIIVRNNNTTNNYVGDGTSGILVWGAQLVTGTQPRDYFPTTNRFNVPRIDYSNGSCPSILVEPQRTNLVLRSEELNVAPWSSVGINVTPNTIISPSGLLNSDTITGDGNLTIHQTFQSNISYVSGTTYTFSVYVKKGTNDFIQISLPNNTFFSSRFANFDINTGVIGNVSAGVTASILNAGNGWYRCIVTSTASATITSTMSLLLITSSTSIRNENNTLNTSVNVWGAQLEVGANATSYIPTVASTVTRNADVISKTGVSSLIGQTEGTLFLDFNYNSTPSTANGRLYSIFDTNEGVNSILPMILGFGSANINQFQLAVFSNGVVTTPISPSASTFVPFGRQKFAIAYNSSGYTVFRNGALFASNTGALPSSLSAIEVGCSTLSPTRTLGNSINSAIIFKTRLTNSQLATLTTL